MTSAHIVKEARDAASRFVSPLLADAREELVLFALVIASLFADSVAAFATS